MKSAPERIDELYLRCTFLVQNLYWVLQELVIEHAQVLIRDLRGLYKIDSKCVVVMNVLL